MSRRRGEEYSQDLRERVLEATGSIREVAKRFGVSPSYVSKVGARQRLTGQRTTKPRGGQRRAILAGREEVLRARVEEVPDATLAELRGWLLDVHGIKICVGALWNALRRMELSFKKKRAYAAEQERPDVRQEREAWLAAQPALDATKLVFLDETWLSTNMARRSGRCPKGQRLKAAIPYGHWKTTTFLAGLCHDGWIAPLVLDGPIDAESFRAYVEQFLAPALHPGQIVIMDNLASHKVAGIREAIEAVGAYVLYLPRYSPDLNPIEQLFAKLKALIRKAAARTLENLWAALADALRRCAPDECRNYLAHAGYRHSI
ncbi:MAG: IS630 family transposase [Thermoanaerobaculia bacterium]